MAAGVRSSAASLPPTSDYPELTTPYSAVSSFNFPTRADPSLLTPVSGSQSPPSTQDQKFPRYANVPDHAHSPERASQANPKMYSWSNNFDINGPAAQTSSPMPPPTTVAHDFMAPTYMSDDRRPTPGPPEHSYTGMYAVSEGADHGIQHQGSPYYMNMAHVEHSSSMPFRDGPPLPLEADRDPSRTHMPSTPLLSQSRPSGMAFERRLSGSTAFPGSPEGSRPAATNPRRRNAGPPRVRKHKSNPRKSKSSYLAMGSGPSQDHKNCLGREEPPPLKENCPPVERCIFESRWRNRHKKGQDMWDSIQADFQKRFNKSHEKEMLQMKFKRARAKYYAWLPEDEEILKKAFIEMEKERYEVLLDKFLDLGGSRNMELNSGDIEVKVVNDLKLEEGFYMEEYPEVGVRRRRKLNTRKRMANGRGDEVDASPNDDMARHPATRNGPSEDEIVRQVHSRRDRDYPWNQGSNVSPQMMGIQMESGMVLQHVARHQPDAQRLRHNSYYARNE